MDKLFLAILNMSLTGGYVILAVMLARLLLRKAPKAISCLLWAAVGFRLTVPFTVKSALSLLPFNSAPVPADIARQAQPHLNSGIRVIDQAAGRILPAAVPAASANPLQLLVDAGAYLWLAGVIAMAVYGIVTYIILRRRLRQARPVGGNVFEVESLRTPMVLGFVRPRVYLPAGLAGEERNYILLHERTHLRRRDHLNKVFAYLVLCLHWFNPLVWLAFMLLSADMEMACDERVLRELGSGVKYNYSLSLVRMSAGRRIFCGSPLAFSEGSLKGRIKNALRFKKTSRAIILIALLLAGGLTLCLALDKNRGEGADLVGIYTLENAEEGPVIKLFADGVAEIVPSSISSYMPPPLWLQY